MKIVNSVWDYGNGFLPTCFDNYSLMLEAFTFMKLDFLLLTKLVKLGITPHQDMD